jgi:hypothetical protein
VGRGRSDLHLGSRETRRVSTKNGPGRIRKEGSEWRLP